MEGSITLLSRSNKDGNDFYKLTYKTGSYNTSNKTTALSWELRYNGTLEGKTVIFNQSLTLVIDGKTFKGTLESGTYYRDLNGGTRIMSGSVTVAHNTDTEKIVKLSLTESGLTANRVGSGSIGIPALQQAFITDIGSFSDEDNPVIWYENPLAESQSVTISLELSAYIDNYSIFTGLSIPGNIKSGSYTLELAEYQRDFIRSMITKGDNTQITFNLRTIGLGASYDYKYNAVCYLINHEPLLNPVVIDTNSRTVALTGDNTTLISGYSVAQFNTNAQARKNTTIDYQRIKYGNQILDDYTANIGTFSTVTNDAYFDFSVTDMRGITTTATVEPTIIHYIDLTTYVNNAKLDANGDITVNIGGKYFSGSFGKEMNSMDIDYQYRENKGEISGVYRITDIMPTMDSNNNYNYTFTISGLNYGSTYTLYIYVIDKLAPAAVSVSTVVSAVPVFDWGKDDFHHHTDVILENSRYLKNSSGDNIIGADYNGNVNIGNGAQIQFDGVPMADFVVEEGSINKGMQWHYRKWNSGRAEAYGYLSVSATTYNALGSWYRSNVQSGKSLPFTFTDIPIYTASFTSAGESGLVWFTTTGTVSATPDFYLIRHSATTANGKVNMIVSGYWK